MSDVRRILVILPNWVGDVVLATPVLVALRRRFPDARITYLCRAYVSDLVGAGELCDACIHWPAGTRGWPAFIRRLRRERFDLALLMPNSFRSALAAWLSGAVRRIGYARDGRGWLLTDRLAPPRDGRRFRPVTMVDYYAALLEPLGARIAERRPTLAVGAADEAAIAGRLGPRDPRRPRVVLNPGGAFGSAKLWPAERFAALADALVERADAEVIVTGTPGERAIAAAIRAAARHALVYCFEPPLGLGPLKALVCDADLLVTNDTGPRHFAIAFDVPVVTIFGPTDPVWTATAGARERSVMLTLDCMPCQQKRCPLGHNDCLRKLEVDPVLAAAEALLADRARDRSGSRLASAARHPAPEAAG
ncbi:MAG: lipopolysaccharide heptosyltransferase II [Phycisphaerae bacterium]